MPNIRKPRHVPLDIEIGTRIRARRLLLGMSQHALADVAGVTRQQVYKYEHGIGHTGVSRMSAMADALGVPITYFVGDGLAQTSNRMPSDLMERPDAVRLMRLYSAIRDEAVRRQVLAIVEAVAEATAPASEVDEQDDESRAG
jgi:transcriptional regulator with XRE-family HTH domain